MPQTLLPIDKAFLAPSHFQAINTGPSPGPPLHPAPPSLPLRSLKHVADTDKERNTTISWRQYAYASDSIFLVQKETDAVVANLLTLAVSIGLG